MEVMDTIFDGKSGTDYGSWSLIICNSRSFVTEIIHSCIGFNYVNVLNVILITSSK